jgi:hypothetical protein
MALTNNLKPQVDLPVWEWMRFNPVGNTSELTCLTTARDGSSRYLYYFSVISSAGVLFRYDTISDTWQRLSTVNVSPVTLLNVKYVKNQGYRGQVLSASSTTLQIPSTGLDLTGYEIEIYSGTGKGQRRTIQSTNAEVVHDSGVVTNVNTSVLTDDTKRYKFNQWEGYGVRLVFGTGFSQYREIIYNSTNALTVFDANYDARNFLMYAFATTSPYATPVLTAGSQAHFAIVSQTINLNSAWDITPDTSSKFKILSHGIWWVSSNSSNPFFNFWYYDILSDRSVQKLTPAGIFSTAIGTDFSLAPVNDLVGIYFTGSITSLSSQSITDNTLNLTRGDWAGTAIEIISGSGKGQLRRIYSNTENTFTLGRAFDEMPAAGSKYAITGEEAVYYAGNARSQMIKYHPERSLWSTGTIIDNGIAFNLVLQKSDLMQSHGITTATRNTNGVTGVNAVPTAAGSNYSVGDLLTITTGGTLGRVRVDSIDPATGAVLSVSVYSAGSGYSTGPGRATTAVAGSGTGCTIEITSIGTIGTITTAISHDFQLGDSVTFKGATEAAWNGSYNISGVQSQTIVEIPITATANAVAKYALSTTLLVDETQNWVPNQFTGKLLCVQSNGLGGAATWRKIIGNSQTTISFVAGVAPTNGNSRYFIQDVDAFGEDEQFLANNELSYGFVSGSTPNSVTDPTKNWLINTWANNKIIFTSASGEFLENIITTNNTSSLNFGRVIAVGSGTNTLGYWNTNGSGSLTANGTTIFTSGNGICWSGTRFVAVGSGTNTIAWSHDGITWNGLGATIHTTSGNAVAWNGIRFITVGSGTNTIAHSNDGNAAATFTGLGTSIFSTQGNAVAWNGTRWVAVGQGTTNTIAHCIDTGSAVTFVGLGTSSFSTAGRGVCWAGTQFVAVGNGTNNYATSSDGVTWSGGGAGPFSTQGNAVAWNGDITIAVGQGTTNTIAYSTDSGSTWTGLGMSIFSTSGNSIAWNGTYWIAGGSGTNTSAFSSDGINWTGNGATIITTQINGIASPTPYKSVVPNIGFTPDSSTKYNILDASGIASAGSTTTLTDVNKKWKTNQWAGKRVLITGGTGVTQELTITSNTATALTLSATTAPDNTSTYTIIGRPVTGQNMSLEWNWSGSLDKGKILISARGNSHTFDTYDLRTNRWDYGKFILGQGDTLGLGTMYALDGDRVYYQLTTSGRILYYDYVKNEIKSIGTIPYGMSTGVLGNRMEIVQTADGLKYLYIMRHTGTEMWRTLIFS